MYLAAGLPIVMTAVPPNARHLADSDVALLVDSPEDRRAWTKQVISLTGDFDRWLRMSSAAHSCAQEFTWNNLLKTFFEKLREVNQPEKLTGNE
jgi:glycosyltransferase involved in cell wall biosynthesis